MHDAYRRWESNVVALWTMAVTQQWRRPGLFFVREGTRLLDMFTSLLAEKEVGEEEEEDILI